MDTKTLLQSVRTELLDPAHLEILRKIDEHDFRPIMKKAMKDYCLTPEESDEMLLALKQYYAIAVLDPINMHAVP